MSPLLALWPFWLAGCAIATGTALCLGIYCGGERPLRRKESQ
jgi:hypothetical protein